MKKIIMAVSLLLTVTSVLNAQTTATNFTAQDCSSTNRTLFTELNNGKIVVLVWVMPCGSCINGAKAAYNAAQSFATSHPGKVLYYMADDLGDATCSDLSTWITSNSIGNVSNMTLFSNAGNVIKESDFGGTGMPHVVVIGGTDHKIYYNKKNSATNDLSGITTAINSAIAGTTGIAEVVNEISFGVSPNPAQSTITITSTNAIKKVVVMSMSGQVMKEETYANGKINPTISLSALATGVYSIKVTDITNKSAVEKIVKE
ncbi:MAG: T9SS type A sorting domain-containing protein [Flavipsychrobacter sp.]|nr:T9SS type A sorting domain-containing protein [Flavipsychrobacter sp.]